jgi:arylformamidase
MRVNSTDFIDISVTIREGMPSWPGSPGIEIRRYNSMDHGDRNNASTIFCDLHVGTHIDTPRHFVATGATIDELPLGLFNGPAFVAQIAASESITPEDLETAQVPLGTQRLLLHTKNSKLWHEFPNEFRPEYVAVSKDAAKWVVNAGISLLGIDYLSIEPFASARPDTHLELLEAGVAIIEGLDLSGVQSGSYELRCLPMKLWGTEAAPARAMLVKRDCWP